VTRNEILYTLNKPEDFILANVELLKRARTGSIMCGAPPNESWSSAQQA